MCENIRVLPPPPPHKYVSTRGVFHLSGQVSWCAGVCDGTGKIEVRIGGGLGF